MNAISPKVTSATVAAAFTSLVGGIVGPHLFPHGTPSDVKGLALGAVTAGITFASGHLARLGVDAPALVKDAASVAVDLGVPFTAIPELDEVIQSVPMAPLAPVTGPVPAVPPVA